MVSSLSYFCMKSLEDLSLERFLTGYPIILSKAITFIYTSSYNSGEKEEEDRYDDS